jgi:hypothetical protein
MTAKKPTDAPTQAGNGYKNAYLHLPFPELADGCSVLIRNPKLLPGDKLGALRAVSDADDPGAQQAAMDKILTDVIVAWRHVYAAADAITDIDLDAEEDLEVLMAKLEAADQEPLIGVTLENVARLPITITNRIAEEFKKTADPK